MRKNFVSDDKDTGLVVTGLRYSVVYLSVTSYGVTGEEWVSQFEKEKGVHIHSLAKELLLSSDFKPTSGVTTKIAILKGKHNGGHESCLKTLKSFRDEAMRYKLSEDFNAEVACLMREKLRRMTLGKMGLSSIVVMHKAIKSKSSGNSCWLGLNGCSHHNDWLAVVDGYRPYSKWGCESGFAFKV